MAKLLTGWGCPISKDLAVVVGASRGLGLEIAKRLLRSGFRVVGTSSREEALDGLQKEHAFPFELMDLSNSSSISTSSRAIIQKHGIPKVLVLNGAIGNDKILGTMHDLEITNTLNINLTGALLATKYLARPMLIEGKGSIVIVGSITAKTGYSGLAVYGAAKAGLDGAVKGLSRELGKRGIRINVVHPGFMDTKMTQGMPLDLRLKIEQRSPFKRFVTTSEVAEVVVFLASDVSSGVSGTSVTVDLAATA